MKQNDLHHWKLYNSFHNAKKKPNLSSGPKLRKINKHERLECFQFRQKKRS